MVILRLCKAALVASVGFFFFTVAMDNMTDYDSNFEFVKHVLSMDDTFPGNTEMWRALPSPIIHHIFYIGIITTESICALTCLYAAWRLARTASGSPTDYYAARIVATVGITLSLLLWMVAFLTVGGEWFLMWQSQKWNGQSAAFRMFGIDGLILVFLWQAEEIPRLGDS